MKIMLNKNNNIYAPFDVKSKEITAQIEDGTYTAEIGAKLSGDELRRAAQNKLYWMWLTDISHTLVESYKGREKNEWHEYFKKEYLLSIYILEDIDGFTETYALLEINYSGNMDELNTKLARILTTTKLSVKQFAEYLNDINHFCNMEGIWLRTDMHLINQAFGK